MPIILFQPPAKGQDLHKTLLEWPLRHEFFQALLTFAPLLALLHCHEVVLVSLAPSVDELLAGPQRGVVVVAREVPEA